VSLISFTCLFLFPSVSHCQAQVVIIEASLVLPIVTSSVIGLPDTNVVVIIL